MPDNNSKVVLVTGASGFIGKYCLNQLAGLGYEVHAVSSRKTLGSGFAYPSTVFWHQVDLLEQEAILALLAELKPSHLLHLAWFAKPGEFWTSPLNLSWLASSLNLLRCFQECGGKRAVFAGSCAEYDWKDGLCSEESTNLRPGTLYGESKRALGQVASAFAKQAGLSFAWGRIFFLFGPYEQEGRLVSEVVQNLLGGRRAKCSSGKQERDFMYVEDVASAFTALVDSRLDGFVNIGSGSPISVRALVEKIGDQLGSKHLLEFAEVDDPPQAALVLADNRKLLEQVQWHPQYSLDEGLTRTIEWWKCQAI